MKSALAVMLLAISILTTAGCGSLGMASARASDGSEARSGAQRATNPSVAAGDIQTAVEDNSAFATDLYGALRSQPGNIFYSPHSISLALAMVYAGARGGTEAQMAKAMRYTIPQDRLHPALNALERAISSRGQDKDAFKLRTVNSAWGQKGYQFVQAYLDTLAINYGAGLRLTDFQKSAEPSRVAINGWVKDQTEGKIADLLPLGSIDNLTRLVLVNAIYFKADWEHKFDSGPTRPGTFNLLDGSQVQVPMMAQKNRFGYAAGQGYQAIELPYVGGECSMVLVVPDAGSFGRFEDSLTSERLAGIVGALKPVEVALTMPKFKFESRFGLKEQLSRLGMEAAFVPGKADLTGISADGELFLSNVFHKAMVAVDEKGTEAAAATAAVVRLTSAPLQSTHLDVDRPFLFLIRDNQTGAILFMGRVVDPR